ncbi:energy transducer TonB [Salinimicrobium oceani]|uniref:Energy transducer TonB n=1 Tax=Salinimicrobium oceani TaxID=2722702 RepID=A0ABX1CVS8_9FLAO|nr:energy transducer TonB [Salinimicrobium oceani]NJW52405.1 energy transducer TonB [Salinimicrobium oceani]
MKSKKNNEADLSKRSTIFFQIGLILSLLLVWQLIEWKVDSKDVPENEMISIAGLEEVDVPFTVVEEVKPPEPPKEVVEEIDIIDDDLDKEETDLASTEATDAPILEVEEVKLVVEEEEIKDYDILSVEEVPVFPGCEAVKGNEARRQCFSENVNKIVGKTFDSDLGQELGLKGLYRIFVSFKIQPDGSIAVIGARGPHPRLEEEAIRVVKKFPEMIPGKQGGRPVGVTYSLPIILKVQD